MGIVRTCCNIDLVDSCVYGCDKYYCTNADPVEYRQLDMSCSGYVNRDLLRVRLKDMWKETDNGKYHLV